jgi:hypothetical protein
MMRMRTCSPSVSNAKRGEVRSYLGGQFAPGKTEEFKKEIYKFGIHWLPETNE